MKARGSVFVHPMAAQDKAFLATKQARAKCEDPGREIYETSKR
jgi:hypothetical protein